MIKENKNKSSDPISKSFDMDTGTAPFDEDEILAERIRHRAFEINKVRGLSPWPDFRDWRQAERDIRAEAGQPGKTQKQAFSP